MTPSLIGRVQTRLFTVFTAGLLWTLLVTPLLPSGPTQPGGHRIVDLYRFTLGALALVAVLGVVVWEPIYQLLQQFRWEKDWPAVFVFLQVVPEGAIVHAVLVRVVTTPTAVGWPTFLIDFVTTWLVIFASVHGPIRVPFLRWRFSGGRIW